MSTRKDRSLARRPRTTRLLVALVAPSAAAWFALACSDPYEAPRFASLAIDSGNNQSAKICTELPEPLVVAAYNQFGELLPGALIAFSAPSGSFDLPTVMTGADGRVRVTYTLGDEPGPVTVTASGWHGELVVEFQITAEPDPPSTLRRVSGNNQTGVVGTTLASQLSVRVEDACGDGVPGVITTWSVSGTGDGELAFDEIVTDEDGFALNTLLLTAAGSLTITASAEGYDPVSFSATAQDPEPEPDPETSVASPES